MKRSENVLALIVLLGELPQNKGMMQYWCVWIKLSKIAHFIAILTTIIADKTSRLFIDFVYKHQGLSKKLVSDRDTRFTSGIWVALCNVLGTKQTMSTTFHP